MAFIIAVEGEPTAAQPVETLLDVLRAHSGAGVTSELTLAEVLAGPRIPHNPFLKRTYLDLMVWSKFLDLVSISRELLYRSADLRFAHRESYGKKLSLPDAIHLVTAIGKKCRYFVSADKDLNPPTQIRKVGPRADGIGEILKGLA